MEVTNCMATTIWNFNKLLFISGTSQNKKNPHPESLVLLLEDIDEHLTFNQLRGSVKLMKIAKNPLFPQKMVEVRNPMAGQFIWMTDNHQWLIGKFLSGAILGIVLIWLMAQWRMSIVDIMRYYWTVELLRTIKVHHQGISIWHLIDLRWPLKDRLMMILGARLGDADQAVALEEVAL